MVLKLSEPWKIRGPSSLAPLQRLCLISTPRFIALDYIYDSIQR
jgi:hypothetical protein